MGPLESQNELQRNLIYGEKMLTMNLCISNRRQVGMNLNPLNLSDLETLDSDSVNLGSKFQYLRDDSR